MPLLGAHLSAAGGVSRAVDAAQALACTALQVFLRAPGRWAAAPLSEDEAQRFRTGSAAAGLDGACFAHAPYLLNLASADTALRERSVGVLVEELQRAGRLGLAGVVLHPGSAGTGSRPEATARCRASIVEAIEAAGAHAATLVLEGTAGAGGTLGRTPEELAQLVEPGVRERLGICLDLAHLWGAGYDLTNDGWTRVVGELEEFWQRAAPNVLHANDTAVALGSQRDRHAPPGEGVLGERFFRALLADERLQATPLVLEIPPGDDNELVAAALDRLRAWLPGRSGKTGFRAPGSVEPRKRPVEKTSQRRESIRPRAITFGGVAEGVLGTGSRRSVRGPTSSRGSGARGRAAGSSSRR